jgi:hypothetical protein
MSLIFCTHAQAQAQAHTHSHTLTHTHTRTHTHTHTRRCFADFLANLAEVFKSRAFVSLCFLSLLCCLPCILRVNFFSEVGTKLKTKTINIMTSLPPPFRYLSNLHTYSCLHIYHSKFRSKSPTFFV